MAKQKLPRSMSRGMRKAYRSAIPEQLRDQLDIDFFGARSALMTAVLALEGKGVETHIARTLRMHVLNALDRIEKTVTGREAL